MEFLYYVRISYSQPLYDGILCAHFTMQSSIISIFLSLRKKFTSTENKKARFKNEEGTFCDTLWSGEPSKWLIPSIAPHFAMQSSVFSIFFALRNKFTSPENKKARFKNEVGTFCDPLRIRT